MDNGIENKEQQSQSIVGRMETILKKASKPDQKTNSCDVDFKSRVERDCQVKLAVAYDESKMPTDSEPFCLVPEEKDFAFPVYIIFPSAMGSKDTVTSPYGRQRSDVIGEDNKLYSIRNFYFFSKDGKSRKYEEVMRITEENQTLEESAKDWGVELDGIRKLEVIPDPKDSRYVDLKPEDYKHILDVLEEIEVGLMVQN